MSGGGQWTSISFENRFALQHVKRRGCWEWTGAKTPRGYGKIRRDRSIVSAHRASFELFIGRVPDGLLVLHSCDNPSCVNPEHLHLGTALDNTREMYERGRNKNGHYRNHPRGVRHHRSVAKLTVDQVFQIRQLLNGGAKQKDVALRFGVDQSTISLIATGKRWACFTETEQI